MVDGLWEQRIPGDHATWPLSPGGMLREYRTPAELFGVFLVSQWGHSLGHWAADILSARYHHERHRSQSQSQSQTGGFWLTIGLQYLRFSDGSLGRMFTSRTNGGEICKPTYLLGHGR